MTTPHLRHAAAITIGALALTGTLVGCSGPSSPERTATTSASASEASAPSETPPGEPTAEASASTSVAPEAMLAAVGFGMVGVDAVVTEPLGAWALPEECAAGAPSTATASRRLTYGNGEHEASIGTQQVAVFADAPTATAEAQRLNDVLKACALATQGQFRYLVEDVAVGAQGAGLGVDYYGSTTTGSGDDAIGYYVVTTRRGNAVTLVGLPGGESTIGASRETVVAASQAAWELLCVYDSAGC